MDIQIKRIYDEAKKSDGKRILIDRLWPRGLTKEKAKIDLWLKDIAPSGELREWFSHDPEKWKEFKKRYFKELKDHEDLIKTIKDESKKGTVTLVYAAKDTEHNNAVALSEYLNSKANK